MLASGRSLKINTDENSASLQIPAGSLEGTLPVIKLTFRSELVIDKSLPIYDAGPSVLDEKSAEKFYNYNGRGYEAPKTLYKMRWAVRRGCASTTFHAKGEGEVALVSNGSSRKVMLKDGSTEEVVIGDDETLEITPPEPFLKGTPLPLTIQSIDLSPQPCPR